MTSTIDGLQLRRELGRRDWYPPTPFGPDGWLMDGRDGIRRVIVTAAPLPEWGDGGDWIHASISRTNEMPTYEDLVDLHRAVWGTTGWAYQVFAPAAEHINIHAFALHLWGRPDGRAELPNFGGIFGSI